MVMAITDYPNERCPNGNELLTPYRPTAYQMQYYTREIIVLVLNFATLAMCMNVYGHVDANQVTGNM